MPKSNLKQDPHSYVAMNDRNRWEITDLSDTASHALIILNLGSKN